MFPSCLKQAIEETTNMCNNICSDFTATSIYPLSSPQQVLKRLLVEEKEREINIIKRMLLSVVHFTKI